MSALIRVCMVLRDYNPRPRSLKTRVGGLCVESILSYIIKPCLGRKKTTRHMHAPLIHFLFCLPRAAIGNTLFCDLHCRNATQQKLELHSLSPVSNGTLCDTLHFLRPVALFSFAQTDIQLLASAWYTNTSPLASYQPQQFLDLQSDWQLIMWRLMFQGNSHFVPFRILHVSTDSLHPVMYWGHLVFWVLYTGFGMESVGSCFFSVCFLVPTSLVCIICATIYWISTHNCFLTRAWGCCSVPCGVCWSVPRPLGELGSQQVQF